MSHEEIERYRKTCDCGKGEIEVSKRIDDWNRITLKNNVICENCKEIQQLKNKEIVDKIEKEELLNEKRKKYFYENYYNLWVEFLNQFKTKKDKFDFLIKESLLRKSTSEIDYLRNTKKAEIPSSILEPKKIKKVLQLLNINDENYLNELNELVILNNDFLNMDWKHKTQ